MKRLVRLLPLALALFGAAAAAQDRDAPDRIARLSYLKGDVTVAPEGTEDGSEAVLNRPLVSGDQLWLDRDSRAELQAGSTTVHLAESTGFSVLNLDERDFQMSLTEGTVEVRVRSLLSDEQVEIETPNATVSLVEPGEYRISIENDGNATLVAVRNGQSEISHERQTFSLSGGQQGRFSGTDYLTANVHGIGPRDEFADWANDRNRRDERSVSSQYVSPEVVGYEDLDRYGSWDSEPGYGHVWYPRALSAGWAPYRFGHWVWVSPWGWTWADRAPWGFAPFHYGHWAQVRSRWCWVPGPRHSRAVYAPHNGGRNFHCEFRRPPIERYQPERRIDRRAVRPPARVLERNIVMRRERSVTLRPTPAVSHQPRPSDTLRNLRSEREIRAEHEMRTEMRTGRQLRNHRPPPVVRSNPPSRPEERRAEPPKPQPHIVKREAREERPVRIERMRKEKSNR